MVKGARKKQAARAQRAKQEEPPPPTGDARKGVKGLKNLGNTCYVNSVVQCMHAATPFRESLPPGNGNSICSSLSSVLKSMSGPGAAVGPKALHSSFCNKFPWFKGHQQHDAHEFFCTLVGAVADEKKKSEEEEGGEEAAKTFQGQLCSSVMCWKCKKISTRVCPFFHLSLPVPECDNADCGLLGLPADMQQAAEHPEPPMAPEEPEAAPKEPPTETPVELGQEAAPATEAPAPDAVEDAFETAEDEPAKSKVAPEDAPPEATPENAEVEETKALVAQKAENGQEEEEPVQEASEEVQAEVVVDEAPVAQEKQEAEEANEQEASEEEEPDQPFTFEVLLRSEKTGKQDYGFKWNMSALSKDQLTVASITPESILDNWNLKQHTLGEHQKIVRPGDQIVGVNDSTRHFKAMLKTMKQEPELTLTIQRADLNAPVDLPAELPSEEDKEEMEDRKDREKMFQRAWKACKDDLPEDLKSMYQGHSLGIKEGSCSLMDCLQKFAGVEAIEEDYHPSYDCSDCAKEMENGNGKKPKTYATSKAYLCGAMPQLLTLQLKRFNRKLQKIKTRVDIPATLDLKELTLTQDVADTMKEHLKAECEKQELPVCSKDENTKYELFGLVQHHGSTLQGGHYTAYVNLGPSLEEPLWYFCNDSVVSKCSLQDVLKAETYVAFYRKQGEED